MHAEMRIAEKQDDVLERNPIFVDKLCCPFCALQLMALGRLDKTRGSTTTKLAWYRFSPYIIYFKTRRVILWGDQVEAIFDKLTPDSKLLFLDYLGKSCQANKYTGLPSLQNLQWALAGK